jgi:RNA polymerase sigma-70 factor (ECF subfamily)
LVDSIDAAPIFVVLQATLGAQARADIAMEDVWQETLWSSWRDRHQHRWVNLTAYRAWLLGIARHRVLDMVRAAGRRKRGGGNTARFTDLGGSDTVGGMLPPRSTTPSRIASNLERARCLERALDRLEPEQRAVVHGRLFEEMSMVEVAAREGLPLSTAKHRFVRGMMAYKHALRAELGEAAESPADGE